MKTCPFGHDCPQCRLWVRVRGPDPQSPREIDEEDCSLAWLPLLIIENSQRQWQTLNAIESFRNEVVKSNNQLQAALIHAVELPKCLE